MRHICAPTSDCARDAHKVINTSCPTYLLATLYLTKSAASRDSTMTFSMSKKSSSWEGGREGGRDHV